VKLWPIRVLESLPGALRGMVDDSFAGLVAGLALVLVYLGIVIVAMSMGHPG